MRKIISTKTPAASAPITASASHNKQKIISTYNMDKRTLLKQTKSQLINLLLKQNLEIKKLLQQNMKLQPKNDDNVKPRKPIPTPWKSVKQIVQDYEDKIILPPLGI